ncbi:hypothetical protein P9429_11655 [Bacillus atrophaeus]|uniref:hypothetical protein n=1 Tax=Bacillus atrophaeus TaxID=1452 RepID=UPI002E1DAF9D|nr:hypothetical protein [Bacillus atrophaeus]
MTFEDYDKKLTDYCHAVIRRNISGRINKEKETRMLRKISEWRDVAIAVLP